MKNTMKHIISAAALFAVVALPGNLRAQSGDVEKAPEASAITVEVENGNWLDMRVYAVRDNGVASRIGTVTSFTNRSFELPSRFSSDNTEIQLIAVPIGSNQRYAATPVVVSRGDVIEWRLGNNLSLSSIFVYAAR